MNGIIPFMASVLIFLTSIVKLINKNKLSDVDIFRGNLVILVYAIAAMFFSIDRLGFYIKYEYLLWLVVLPMTLFIAIFLIKCYQRRSVLIKNLKTILKITVITKLIIMHAVTGK